MPISASHILTATTPDDPAYEIRPSHWNSSHALTVDLTGSEISNAFSNLNGFSFGLNGGGAITGSYTVPSTAGLLSAIKLSAGTQSSNLSAATFADGNGISFGLDAGTVTASHNGLTAQSNQAFSADGGSSAFQTLVFANSQGVSFSNSNGSVVATVKTDYLTSQSNQALSGSNGSFAFQTATFGNLNGFSFYTSNGSMVGSYTVPSQSVQPVAISGSNGSFNFSTATFGNLNGMSFYTSNGSMVGSYTVPTQSNQTVGLYASSNTTLTSSGTVDARSMTFRGIGGISVGYSNGELLLSGGGGTTNQTGPNIAAGSQTATSGTVVFLDSNGIQFGMSGSTRVTASLGQTHSVRGITAFDASSGTFSGQGMDFAFYGNAAGGISTGTPNTLVIYAIPEAMSFFRNVDEFTTLGTAQANSLVSIQPFSMAAPLVCSNVLFAASYSVTTTTNNSSAWQDLSVSGVIYSRNASTLNSILSFSSTYTQTWTSNNTGAVTGAKGFSATFAQTTLSQGEYFMALHMSTTNTGTGANSTALGHAVSMILSGQHASAANLVRPWGAATNASIGLIGGQGIISTNATRASIGISDYTMTGTRGLLAGFFFELRNSTFQL